MIDILTAILVIVTGFYAWATFRILKANESAVEVMKQQSDALIRPYIAVSTLVHPKHPLIYLKITNTGKTPAKNVRLEIDKSFYQFGMESEERNIAKFHAFQKPIECLPPGTSLFFDLAQGFVIFGKEANPDKTPTTFSIKATYSYADKTVDESTQIDLNPYLNSRNEPNPFLDELEKIKIELENIKKAIAGLNRE